MARALVTGATGFIGKRLVAKLAARGDEVTCLVRETSNRAPLEAHGVAFAVGDVTQPDTLAAPVAGADVVYHLAAMLKQPWHPEFLTTNAEAVGFVADACAAAPTPPVMVVVSSIAAVGPSPDDRPLTEAAVPAPVSRYGRSKLNGERAARDRAGAVPITIVRPPVVFGEGDTASLPLFQTAARGLCLAPTITEARLSLVYVDDLCDALIAAGDRGERIPAPTERGRRETGIYFAAFDQQPTVIELGRMVADAIGRKRVLVVRAPAMVSKAVGRVGETLARLRDKPSIVNADKTAEATAGSWICSVARARDQLGFTPSHSLADRLAQTGAWYREQGWL